MRNNDILARLRYTWNFGDDKMMAIFAHVGENSTRTEVCDWLKQEEDPAFQPLSDRLLSLFLDGFIIEMRGKKAGFVPERVKSLSNNTILVKLKIALRLTSHDMLAILDSVGFPISEHELSALFRKPDHKHFRPCQDQLLRNFMKGIQKNFCA